MIKTPLKTAESRYDVAIIGAGLIGLSSADALSRRGLKVLVADIANQVMQGTSFCNSGMIHPSQSWPWAQLELSGDARLSAARDVASLAADSAAILKSRAAELGLPQSRRSAGCLQLFRDDQARDKACSGFEAIGIAYERRSAGALFSDRPAVFFQGDASGNSYDYGGALADDLRARGVDIALGQGAALWQEEGRVIGLRLGNRDIAATDVIMAAGMQSARLASWAGLTLPMKRAVGWAVNFARPVLEPSGFDLPAYPVMEVGFCAALTVFEDTVRLSGTIDLPDERGLLSLWGNIAPELMQCLDAPIGAPWRGERPMSLTGKPFIGRSSVPGLWLNTAHGHMGWTLCAGSAELLARMIADGESDERFAAPKI